MIPAEAISNLLVLAVTALVGVIWRNLNWRLKQHEERMQAVDATLLYLREQGHALRNLLPNPMEIEARRIENRENFNQLFSMIREVEKQLNGISGELRAGRPR